MRLCKFLADFLERFREKNGRSPYNFIDLEATYDRIYKELIWHVLKKKYVHKRYVNAIKTCRIITSVKDMGRGIDIFPISISFHQKFTLSLHLLAVVIDDISKAYSRQSLMVYVIRVWYYFN